MGYFTHVEVNIFFVSFRILRKFVIVREFDRDRVRVYIFHRHAAWNMDLDIQHTHVHSQPLVFILYIEFVLKV